MVSVRSVPGRARLGDGRVVEDGHAARVALGDDDPRLAAELRLVLLLDAVLAAAVAVDEAEEVRGEARVRSAARLRVDALGLGLERQPGDRPVGRWRSGSGRRRRRSRPWRRIRYLEFVASLSRSAIASSGASPRIAVSVATVCRRVSGVSWSGAATSRSRWTVVARTIVPVRSKMSPRSARGVDGDRRLGQRLGRQSLLVDDLPVAESGDQRHRADDEDDEQEEESAARIRTAQHRSVDRLVRLEDDGFGQLTKACVEALLADGGLAAQPVRDRSEARWRCPRAAIARARAARCRGRSPRRGPAGRARRTPA